MITKVCLLLICICFSLGAYSQKGEIQRPRLVVGLVVDQMRWDYLTRYRAHLTKEGLGRLINEGFSYDNTFINYAPSVTAAGHASIYTGSVPALHGIVGNEWIDNLSGKYCLSVKDSNERSVGSVSNRGNVSPVNLQASTIGDELKLATNFRSRVFGVSFKDRSAIIPGGRGADAAYWFDDSTGNWISSSYYMANPRQWVTDFNNQVRPDVYMKNDWRQMNDSNNYIQSTADDVSWEKPFPHESKPVFPHSYTKMPGGNYASFGYSPFANAYTIDFAMSLIKNEKLGFTGNTDMLCLSLSSIDIIGHKMGPNSIENEDNIMRIDSYLTKLFNFLDSYAGKGNYLLFLTSDHGVAHAPGFLETKHMNAGSLRLRPMTKELNDSCRIHFGIAAVSGIYTYQVYLNHSKMDSAGIDSKDVERYIISLFKKKPEVMNVFAYSEFDKLILPEKIKQMFANGYCNKRSGDIQIMLKPQYSDNVKEGAEHATVYNYDTHIPLIWYGWRIPKGHSKREVYITDIAPTVSSLLNIQMPNASIGQVLEEVKSEERKAKRLK